MAFGQMRVLVDGISLTKPLSGISRALFELLKVMESQDESFEFIIAVPNEINSAFTSLTSETFLKKSSTLYWYAVSLAEIAGQCQPDLFWSPSHRTPIGLPKRVRVVVTIHDLVWKKAPSSMKPTSRLIEPILFYLAVKKATKIVCVSHSTARDLSQCFPTFSNKLSVVHLASKFKSSVSVKDENFILFVGTFEPRKNIKLLITAFEKFCKQSTSTPFLILAGQPGWGAVDVKKYVVDSNYSNRIKIILNPTDFELNQLYQTCSILLMPSLYEGFGIPVVEAMSFGKPVVVSNNSSFPEVAGEGGVFVDPNCSNDISKALLNLFDNTNVYKQLSRDAKAQSRNFSWQQSAQKLRQLFERLKP